MNQKEKMHNCELYYPNDADIMCTSEKVCTGTFNLTLVDDTHIYVGDYTLFGPNVTVATAGHPILPELREVNEHDRQYYFKERQITEEHLKVLLEQKL